MKKIFATLAIAILFSTATFAQSLVPYKAGHTFNIGLPAYMAKTSGLNDNSAIQFKNSVKDVYGFVIFDTKEELKLAEINFASLKEYVEDFMTDFGKEEEKRTVSEVKYKTIGDINFAESEITYYDKEEKSEIYHLVCAIETKTAYYKLLCWTSLANKDKFKADFQAILYSLKD